MGLRLYDYGASGNCYKVRLLLAQLGLDYERVPVDIFAGETLTDEFAAVNPVRSTPVLEYEAGTFLPESNAILVYLASGTPFLPADPEGLGQVTRWLLYEQTDVIPAIAGLRFRLITGRLSPDDEDAVRRRRAAHEVLALLDVHLRDRDFFVGEYSVADIALFAYVHVAPDAGIETAEFEAVHGWLARVEAQPGYMNDLQPYPSNSHVGVSRSVYDAPAAGIVSENLAAMQAVYFAAALEELRLFHVVDRLVELYLQGALPLADPSARSAVDGWRRSSSERPSEAERRDLYGRALGLPGGEPGVDANREFERLWIAFVAAAGTDDPVPTGRELAANLSGRGAGTTHALAARLREATQGALDVLSEREIQAAVGARSVAEVVHRLGEGTGRDIAVGLAAAKAGASIVGWLAAHAADVEAGRAARDDELRDACERWLAAQPT